MDMIAKKAMTYATRRLKAGDPFQARSRTHARMLHAVGKAEYGTAVAVTAAGSGTGSGVEIGELRDEYERLAGKRPFNGWDADTLTTKIAEKSAGQ